MRAETFETHFADLEDNELILFANLCLSRSIPIPLDATLEMNQRGLFLDEES